jgi:hypothetical protein
MFIFEAGPDVARVDSLWEAQAWLRALTPGAEVTVRGLGRVVVLVEEVLFYPLGRTNPQELLLEDVVAMLPDMVDLDPEVEVQRPGDRGPAQG